MLTPFQDLVVADTLSRAPLSVLDPEAEQDISYFVHTVASNMPISDAMMMRLQRVNTSEDESLQQLKTTVINRWPETKKDASVKVREY